MIFEFGPFRLDEAARTLSLARQEVMLQPRVFDLLVYLIKSRARVVSKDELLDVLWPGVTVTENSLQRAVSTLRGVLRQGGMQNAIRNFPRTGYRFCADADENVELAEASALPAPQPAKAAKLAMQEQRWSDAVVAFASADAACPLASDELESYADALQCLGRPSDAIPLLVRAVAAYTQAGQEVQAAHAAIGLSTIHLERGEKSVAKGWIARASEMVDRNPDCAAAGELLWMMARIAAMDGEPQRAHDLADAAYEFGRKTGNVRIEVLGLMYRGFYRLSLGETRLGLSDQDHAAALALSHQVDPITGGVLYCNILWACRTYGDWTRANEWTLGYQGYCARNHMGLSGSCHLHRAECLGVQGSLDDARKHILDAIDHLPADAPWAIGDAYRVLGDVEAAVGKDDAAMAAYEKCQSLGWDAEPGHAMLLVERGQIPAACASLERSLIGRSWWTLQRKGMLRAYLALAYALAGQKQKAGELVKELSGTAELMPSANALIHEAMAVMDLASGKRVAALTQLCLSRQLWTSVGSRLNAARLRLRIAELQIELDDRQGAAEEIRAALAAGKALGSIKLTSRCEEFSAKWRVQ